MKRATFLATIVLSQTVIFAEESLQTQRFMQVDNEHVKVWRTVIAPNQPLKMHRHDCPRVIVGLKGGTLIKVESTGEESDLTFETGKAYWLTEDPEDTLHADINPTNEAIEVMVIEIKALSKSEE